MNCLDSINFMGDVVMNSIMMSLLHTIDGQSEDENAGACLLRVLKDCGFLNEETGKMAEPHIMEINRHLDEIFKCFDKTFEFDKESKENGKERKPFTLSKDNLKNCCEKCEKPVEETKPEIHQIVNIVNFG